MASETIQSDVFRKLYPERYYAEHLHKAVRPDGRSLGASRDISLALGVITTADASALAKIGSTTALACIKCEVAPPALDTPDVGRIQLQVELPPLCSAETRPGRSPEIAAVLTDHISSILATPGMLNLQQLCVDAGKAVWVIQLDVYVLDADGSLLDACLLATLGTLGALKLPSVEVDDVGNVVPSTADGEQGSAPSQGCLQLGCLPVASTCGFYGAHLIVDPTAEEEPLLDGLVTVVADDQGQLLSLRQIGGTKGTSPSQLRLCIEAARRRNKKALAVLQPIVK